MSLVKVEGFEQYKKDTTNGGVINTDKRSFENYKNAKLFALQRNTEQRTTQENVMALQSEINNIKSDLSDIKSILTQLLEKGK